MIATVVVLFAPLLLIMGCAGVDSGDSDGYSAPMTEQLNELLAAHQVPGVSVAVWEDGKVSEYAAGVQSAIFRRPVTPDTRFQIASITKPLAAYVYLERAQALQIDLDAPVSELIGDSVLDGSEWSRAITSRHLLSHTAGLSNSLLPMDRTVHRQPGSGFGYSGVGYATLTKVLQRSSGSSLDTNGDEGLFQQVRMADTTFRMPFFTGGRQASPHVPGSTVATYVLGPFLLLLALLFGIGMLLRVLPALHRFSVAQIFQAAVAVAFVLELVLMGLLLPKLTVPILVTGAIGAVLFLGAYWISRNLWLSYAAAIVLPLILLLVSPVPIPFDITPAGENAAYSGVSTAGDLARFGAHLLSDDPIALAMRTPVIQVSDSGPSSEDAWGLGVGIESYQSGSVYWHSGINPGSRALLVADPATQRVVAVLTNSESGFGLAREIVRTVLGIDGRWSTS
jgi:CubicO group peptidase (beta-lactamase class C family)